MPVAAGKQMVTGPTNAVGWMVPALIGNVLLNPKIFAVPSTKEPPIDTLETNLI